MKKKKKWWNGRGLEEVLASKSQYSLLKLVDLFFSWKKKETTVPVYVKLVWIEYTPHAPKSVFCLIKVIVRQSNRKLSLQFETE